MIVKNRRKVDSYTHVLPTTPEDSFSHCRIWRYGERSFPGMCTASFLSFFTSGRRSGGRRSNLFKVPNIAHGQRIKFSAVIHLITGPAFCYFTHGSRWHPWNETMEEAHIKQFLCVVSICNSEQTILGTPFPMFGNFWALLGAA